ncbi:hypothetical protein N658DRAFT_495436 [Parathielavia hyrcaniae]|uniref:Uncharacterized protein n=1 Tax=Parathielavia hyrcaniae TaxID=113614 RepID=A0AAN6T2W3_9PEZI|nr:hypothetical protein N658DRAFT_495436 [Parathielavia hyrcaniae]
MPRKHSPRALPGSCTHSDTLTSQHGIDPKYVSCPMRGPAGPGACLTPLRVVNEAVSAVLKFFTRLCRPVSMLWGGVSRAFLPSHPARTIKLSRPRGCETPGAEIRGLGRVEKHSGRSRCLNTKHNGFHIDTQPFMPKQRFHTPPCGSAKGPSLGRAHQTSDHGKVDASSIPFPLMLFLPGLAAHRNAAP